MRSVAIGDGRKNFRLGAQHKVRTGSGSDRVTVMLLVIAKNRILIGWRRASNPVATAPGSDFVLRTKDRLSVKIEVVFQLHIDIDRTPVSGCRTKSNHSSRGNCSFC